MTGFAAARHWPAPEAGLGLVVVGAAAVGIAAAVCALRPGRVALAAWGVLLAVASGLGGFVLLHARYPTAPDDQSRPPREITVSLRIRQVFPVSPAGRQYSGLGEVAAAGALDHDLIGRMVYYSAIRRISVPPRRSGSYEIRGVLEPLPVEAAGFNAYLANLGIRHRIARAHLMTETTAPGRFQVFCVRAHERLEEILRHGLDAQPQVASLYLAMLLGEKAMLSAAQENAYMRSGTFHIFSISGLHVGAIAGALYFTGRLLRVPRKGIVVVSLPALWLYVEITGASAPAMRSFLMIAFVMAYQSFRLPGNLLAALVAAALATLLWDPMQLFSTGFQMSYAVVIALVAMGRPLSDKWSAAWKPFAFLPRADWRWHHREIEERGRKLITMSAACWTAFLASTPSSIGYFGLFSPGSLVANLLVIPLSFVVLWAGFISLVAGLAGLLPVSAVANLLAAQTVVAMDWLLRHGTALPFTWFTARYRAEWLAWGSMVLMTLLLLTCAAGRWAPRYGGYWPPFVLLVLLVILGVKFG